MSKPTLPHPKEIVKEEIQAALDKLSDREIYLLRHLFVVCEVNQVAALVSPENAKRFLLDWKESRQKTWDLSERRFSALSKSLFDSSVAVIVECVLKEELKTMLSSGRAAEA